MPNESASSIAETFATIPVEYNEAEDTEIEGVRKNPILVPKESGEGYELAPRMRDKHIPRDKISYALAMADSGMLRAAEDTLACRVLRLKHAACPDNHEVYATHAHCDLTFCDDCGWGKNRAYWFLERRPGLEERLMDSKAIMYTLWIDFKQKPKDARDLVERQRSLHVSMTTYLYSLYTTIKGKNFFAVLGDDLDMESTRATVRVFYMGPRFSHEWIRRTWQRAAGGTWAMFKAESGDARKLLNTTLNGTARCLSLPGEQRAALQRAFRHQRTIRTRGKWAWLTPEGFEEGRGHEVEWEHKHVLGFCRQCQQRLVRIPRSTPLTLTELFTQYGDVILGTGKTFRFIPKQTLLVDKSGSSLPDVDSWTQETGSPPHPPPVN